MGIVMSYDVEIYDDTSGDSLKVRPDGDGLGLFEIQRKVDGGKVVSEIVLSREEALKLIDALKFVIDYNPAVD